MVSLWFGVKFRIVQARSILESRRRYSTGVDSLVLLMGVSNYT